MMHTDATANGVHRVQQDGAPDKEYTPKNVLITGSATLRKRHALGIIASNERCCGLKNERSKGTQAGVPTACAPRAVSLIPSASQEVQASSQVTLSGAWSRGTLSTRLAAILFAVNAAQYHTAPSPNSLAYSRAGTETCSTGCANRVLFLQVVVLDKLDYCSSLRNLAAFKGPNFRVC